ncbi:MAG: DUF1667 domain-containing protein [Anaerolineae bacterium]|nr:DUF1667 domain-containing protein [Anaerolineae bacterium]
MRTTENVICITCPKGCTLEVLKDGESILEIRQGCKKGHSYVQQELTDPRRMVASTVKIRGALHPLLPVYTLAPFPKGKILELMKALRAMQVDSPVKTGQVVLPNALDTGIDIIASRDM